MVAGDVEIALDLGGVQVHGQHPIHPRFSQQVGNEFGGDRLPSGGLAVGAGVAVIRHHCGDLPGRGPLAGIHHDQQLHQVIVHRGAGGLDQKDIAAADRLLNLDVKLAVCEAFDHPRPIWHAQIGANFLGQGLVGGATEQPQSPGVVIRLARAALGRHAISGQKTGHGGR